MKLISLKVVPNNTGNPIDELREEVSEPAGSPTILMEKGAKSNVLTISVQTVVGFGLLVDLSPPLTLVFTEETVDSHPVK